MFRPTVTITFFNANPRLERGALIQSVEITHDQQQLLVEFADNTPPSPPLRTTLTEDTPSAAYSPLTDSEITITADRAPTITATTPQTRISRVSGSLSLASAAFSFTPCKRGDSHDTILYADNLDKIILAIAQINGLKHLQLNFSESPSFGKSEYETIKQHQLSARTTLIMPTNRSSLAVKKEVDRIMMPAAAAQGMEAVAMEEAQAMIQTSCVWASCCGGGAGIPAKYKIAKVAPSP